MIIKTVAAVFISLTFSIPSIAAEPTFPCSISTEIACISQGNIPKVKVSITNKSGKNVYMVGSLDGSDVGWRFPKCGFEILDTTGKPVPDESMGRCGNMNVLEITDFVNVSAGAQFNPFGKGFFGPYQLQRFASLPPGTYILRFYYQTSAKGVEDYFGDERARGKKAITPKIQKLFENVPLLDIRSNDLKITVQKKQSVEEKSK